MNPKLLIDAIVQQTTVLLAQLSTTAGVRAPLSTIADQVFVELAREIERQGVSKKVAADMFGLALRTYQTKVQRLEESVGEREATLWEAVLSFVEDKGAADRRTLLDHFERGDPQSLAAVLRDLCESGLLYRTGSGVTARYRVVPVEEREEVLRAQDAEALSALVRVAIYRGVSTEGDLCRRLGAEPARVREAVSALIDEGTVQKEEDGSLRTAGVIIPAGASVGWEAAVFDHYQALVTALTRKLSLGSARSASDDSTGGATVSFEIDPSHPLREEVYGLLRTVRRDVDDLWRRVGEYNQQKLRQGHSLDCGDVVTFYFGQSVQEGKRP